VRRPLAHLAVSATAVGVCALVLWLILRVPPVEIAEVLSAYHEGTQYGQVTFTYPQDETLFPPEIVAPTFRWRAAGGCDGWLVTVSFPDGPDRLNALAERTQWTPSDEQWRSIKHRSTVEPARVTVLGFRRRRPKDILAASSIAISTSEDEVGAPLFYREVNLPFIEAVKDPSRIRWRFGCISRKRPPIVLEKLPVCGNCHSFSAAGSVLGMDVDYANDKGSYVTTAVDEEIVLAREKIMTWSDYGRDDGEKTFGLLSQVSPDGRYVVSTVKDRSVFVPKEDLAFSQLFFPIKGILAVHDRVEKTFRALPGADDKRFVQSNPTWSPDGKYIVFARSRAYRLKKLTSEGKVLLSREDCEEFLQEGKTFLFDLYRVPFNGGEGGEPRPLEGASNNGMSNFFPKYSPDGRWIVFCKARSFMLLQPDSELWIMPAEGGAPRHLRCNTCRMNSWHSWSPNGRWLAFSSKANGAYTQLFLTHIDEEGRSTPPVVLDHFTAPDRAANIPEFVNASPGAIRAIREQFVDDVSFVRAGQEYLKAREYDSAIRSYHKALELNPRNARAHLNLGAVLKVTGRIPEAEMHLARSIEIDPNNATAHANLGALLISQGRHAEAIGCYRRAVRLRPKDSKRRNDLGSLLLREGRVQEAVRHLAEAVRLDPNSAFAQHNLGQAHLAQSKLPAAVWCFSEAVRLDPTAATSLHNLGAAMYRMGRTKEAIGHLDRAAQIDPTFEKHRFLGDVLFRDGQLDRAVVHYERAVRLRPDDPRARNDLAAALVRQGRLPQAAAHYRHLLKVKPDDVIGRISLASILVSTRDPALRNTREATAHALEACRLSGQKSPTALHVLAQVHAEAGRFHEALAAAEKALPLARAAGQDALARSIEDLLGRLRRHVGGRDPRSSPRE
jgi:tetratricopeptide (TPR) repeat protein